MIEHQKINGAKIAKLFEKDALNTIETVKSAIRKKLPHNDIRPPAMISFFRGSDPAAAGFTKRKEAKAKELGINFNSMDISDMGFDEAAKKIRHYNQLSPYDGVMIQISSNDPNKTDTRRLIQLIDPAKDVDGLTGKGPFLPATVEGVNQIILAENITLEGQVIALVGSRGFVGVPFVPYLKSFSPTLLIEVDKKIPGTSVKTDLKDADVIFSCVGFPGLIRGEFLKIGVIAFDIGLGDYTTMGDLDPSVYQVASEYTPFKGGVGPNTVIALMRNVAKSYAIHLEKLYRL